MDIELAAFHRWITADNISRSGATSEGEAIKTLRAVAFRAMALADNTSRRRVKSTATQSVQLDQTASYWRRKLGSIRRLQKYLAIFFTDIRWYALVGFSALRTVNNERTDRHRR